MDHTPDPAFTHYLSLTFTREAVAFYEGEREGILVIGCIQDQHDTFEPLQQKLPLAGEIPVADKKEIGRASCRERV